MEYQNILELWDRFEASKATEMVLDFQGTHFSLKKEGPSKIEDAKSSQPEILKSDDTGRFQVSDQAVHVKKELKEESAISSEKPQEDATGSENLIPIKAPLVGTFYAAPSPDAEAFVKVGKEVKKGDVIGIIEAMKLMNELTAAEDGIVKEILVADGDFVAFDQTLILLAGR